MKNASFVISIDSSFEMLDNFFQHFLADSFVKESEVIIVNDCINNIKILNYLNQMRNQNNIKVIDLEEKVGYGKANNIGVDEASREYIFFINTDVFAEENCFEKMYNHLEQNTCDCVQPLLIWPQNNRIQCAGSFFGPYYKNHLFAGRRLETIALSSFPTTRQALTSALYAMKKDTFLKHGKFDEFYYNKLESFELSLKLTLAGKKCNCITDAIAFHSQGAGRGQYYFDFYQQEAYFWTHMGNKITPDITKYYAFQITEEMRSGIFNAIAITQTRNVKDTIDLLPLKTCSYIEINGINPNKINLYDLLPHSTHNLEMPILFFVENITNLLGNKKWFETRKARDIVLDTYGNLLYVDQI
ncbi:MAG: glycosyltransferase family 2 protein [Bacilli bacterium]|nr:glycosyltransferase family 2 protein [Bacilli bacterium]